jgi:prenyltransferase beta subunit
MTSILRVRSVRSAVLMCLVLLMTASLSPRATAQEATPDAADPLSRAVAWLVSQQADDGGFIGFSGASDPGATADAVIALAAAGGDEAAAALDRAVAYLETQALVYAQTGAGQAAKLALAVIAAGGDPTSFATINPLILATMSADPATGRYGSGMFDHALTMLALAGAGEDVPAAAMEALRASQTEDGSWAFDGTVAAGAGDTNTTALVVQAIVAAGHGDDPIVEPALAYLKTVQGESGGFSFQPGDPLVPDANSTAIVVQAIIAVGQDPSSNDWKNASGALAAFQNDSGAFRYNDDQPDDNLFATLQAIPAVAGVPLPVVGETPSDQGTPVAGWDARRAA